MAGGLWRDARDKRRRREDEPQIPPAVAGFDVKRNGNPHTLASGEAEERPPPSARSTRHGGGMK